MWTRNLVAGLGLTLLVGAAACDDDGMEAPLEATFDVTVENVSTVYEFAGSGAFDTPEGANEPGPILPGDSYRVEFHAAPAHRLSFATMFVQSNDLFYAPDEDGIPLYDQNGSPVTGDVTAQVDLWDSGTELNQEPGLGEDQAPRQDSPDTGADDPDPTVRLAEDEFGNLPADEDVIQVTVEHLSGTRFALTIENVSTGSTLQTSDGESHAVPLAPGVWVVHSDPAPLFTSGEPDRGEGLEALAEDGVPSTLASSLSGAPGIESSGVFNTPDGAGSAGPLMPGQSYSFSVTAEEGDRLSLATMLVQTNDLFYAPSEAGIDLFAASGAVSGDITDEFALWDAGTEVNEAPGFGLNQAPRQPGPDTGPDEGGNVRLVDDEFTYPAVDAVIRVTITPTQTGQ